MKKGSQNAVILLLTISLYLLSCSSNEVDVVNVELTNSGNKIDSNSTDHKDNDKIDVSTVDYNLDL